MRWLAAEAGGVGLIVVQFLLTIVIAAVMYSGGEAAALGIRKFGARFAGQRGEDVVLLAARAIRGVALGVVVTALVQALLGGLGLAVAGIPFAGVLTAVMLLFCIAQLGPTLVLLPATVWLYWTGDNVWGSLLLVWTIFVGTLDNFLRPVLIKQGADLPLLLIFAGVIGGLLSLGLLGIFVGPVVLAVSYTPARGMDQRHRRAPADLTLAPALLLRGHVVQMARRPVPVPDRLELRRLGLAALHGLGAARAESDSPKAD